MPSSFVDVERELISHGVEINPDWSEGDLFRQLGRIRAMKEHSIDDRLIAEAQALPADVSRAEGAAVLTAHGRHLPQRAIIATLVA